MQEFLSFTIIIFVASFQIKIPGESPQSFNHCQTGASPNNLKSVNELEKQLTSLQNQNFNLKLKIYFLEEQKTQPNEGERELTKQIVNLKVFTN